LSPDAVRKAITPRTKAILAVDIFGHPFAAGEIAAIAKEHGISIIEDASQAPGARYKGRYAGTLGDIGVFSLNYHKHIHCGEGGIIVTDDDQLAERMQLIRNHAEAVVGPMGRRDIANMVGFNFRMTELEAAIARCQLLKLESLLVERRARIASLNERLREIPALMMPKTAEECVHSYYVHVLKFDEAKAGVSRDSFVKAVAAELPSIELKEDEGACISAGYVKPLYNLPVFQQRISIGRDGYPWRLNGSESQVSYAPGICPVAERMHQSEVILHEYVSPFMTESDLDDLASIFLKVWSNRESI
jgi:dTDP-4-amino-4,6-dideoxygalactose transaminase